MGLRDLNAFAGVMLCALLGAGADRACAFDWSNAWTTPAQRAQRLLDSGHPLEAARLFNDPKRRAYAELRGGRYAAAARQLAPFHDVDSEYNRGNALARAGDLRAALVSYDAALEQVPDDPEVRHNRDLVARALERRSAQRSGSGTPQQGGSGKQQGSESSQRGGSQGSSGANDSGSRAGSPKGQQSGGSSTGSASPGDESEQAKRDAQLAAQMQRNATQSRQGRASSSGATGNARGGKSGTDASERGQAIDGDWPPPESEQTLALEQWLRRIPEDPGGLLRRKFLIEHIERHQGTEP